MSSEWLTPEYLREFRCLGADCEDTCCQSWDVHYDKAHYDRLMEQIAADPTFKDYVTQHLIPNDPSIRKPQDYALIKFDSSHYCPFLDEARWCEIHRRYGTEVLSNVCAYFPRVFSRCDNSTEMTAALSCPEVVRRCFNMELSHEWTDLEQSSLPRQEEVPIARQLSVLSIDAYQRGFVPIRQLMIELMAREDFSFEARLFFLANFTSRLAVNYHQNCNINPVLIDAEIARMQDKNVMDSLDDFFERFSGDEPIAMIVIQSILRLHLQHAASGRLATMVAAIFTEYAQNQTGQGDVDIFTDHIPPNHLWQRYQQDWQPLNAQWGVQLESCLAKYVINCLQREWFITLPDPFIYTHLLTIRVAVLKFLIAAYKPIQEFVTAHTGASETERQQLTPQFIDLVVSVVYPFARGLDQNLALLQVVYEALAEQQMMSFDYSLPMIRF